MATYGRPTLKLASSNENLADIVIGEATVVFTNGGVYFSYSDYVTRNPAAAVGYLKKLTDEITRLIDVK